MDIGAFFTEFDDSVTGSSQLDPLGIRIIWQGLGQKIFNNMISSISNDIRNYTLSLLLHGVVKDVIAECTFHPALQATWKNPENRLFKERLFIFLENLFIYSFVSYKANLPLGNNREIDTGGILGIEKGLSNWKAADHQNPEIMLSFNNDILVKQLSLGVAGRYKTPLVKMGFLTDSWHYPDDDNQNWTDFNQLLQNNDLEKLRTLLKELAIKLLNSNNGEPRIKWNEVGPDIPLLFCSCFKSSEYVGSYAAPFWIQLTGLNQGAAGAVYSQIINPSNNSPYMTYKQASEHYQHADKQLIIDIILIEPFLAEMELLFSTLCSPSIHTISDTNIALAPIRGLVSFSKVCPELTSIPQKLSLSAAGRLTKLIEIAKNSNTFEELVTNLQTYHQKIMIDRGQSAWFYIDHDGKTLKRHTHTKPPIPEQIPGQYWWNRYYFDELKNMARGLQSQPRGV
jgi:hypothetical protein